MKKEPIKKSHVVGATAAVFGVASATGVPVSPTPDWDGTGGTIDIVVLVLGLATMTIRAAITKLQSSVDDLRQQVLSSKDTSNG